MREPLSMQGAEVLRQIIYGSHQSLQQWIFSSDSDDDVDFTWSQDYDDLHLEFDNLMKEYSRIQLRDGILDGDIE